MSLPPAALIAIPFVEDRPLFSETPSPSRYNDEPGQPGRNEAGFWLKIHARSPVQYNLDLSLDVLL